MDLPNMWTLSGRSHDGMLLAVDLPDDFLDSVSPSKASSQRTGRSDEDVDDVVRWLRCFSSLDALLTWLLTARRLSADGGPSTAGSSRSAMGSMGDDSTTWGSMAMLAVLVFFSVFLRAARLVE
jgi:hypothetical protein